MEKKWICNIGKAGVEVKGRRGKPKFDLLDLVEGVLVLRDV